MEFKEGSMKCDGCDRDVPETSTGSCLGHMFHDDNVIYALQIVIPKKNLSRICSFEGTNWFCKECLDVYGFCKSCQDETTPEQRQKVSQY